jgi:hypothetical protein
MDRIPQPVPCYQMKSNLCCFQIGGSRAVGWIWEIPSFQDIVVASVNLGVTDTPGEAGQPNQHNLLRHSCHRAISTRNQSVLAINQYSQSICTRNQSVLAISQYSQLVLAICIADRSCQKKINMWHRGVQSFRTAVSATNDRRFTSD